MQQGSKRQNLSVRIELRIHCEIEKDKGQAQGAPSLQFSEMKMKRKETIEVGLSPCHSQPLITIANNEEEGDSLGRS